MMGRLITKLNLYKLLIVYLHYPTKFHQLKDWQVQLY